MAYGTKVTTIDGSKNAEIYFKKYGGAAGGVSTWVNVTYEEGRVEMVYYSGAKESLNLQWLDKDTANSKYGRL